MEPMNKVPKTQSDILISLFKTDDELLGKRYFLDKSKKLSKKTVASLSSGKVHVLALTKFDELCITLSNLTDKEALSYGIPEDSKVNDVFTIKSQKNLSSYPEAIARDNDHFAFACGPGVLMLDCDDEPGLPNEVSVLDGLIKKACPELSSAPSVHCASSSSHIRNKQTGEIYSQLKGQRFYFGVKDARDIPRVGELIFKRLVILGYGKIRLSSSGQMLLRTIIDGAVFQPERLDFGAKAACVSPIEQKPTKFITSNIDNPLLNTYLIKDLSPEELTSYSQIVSNLKTKAKPEQEKVQKNYIDTKASLLAKSQKIKLEDAKAIIKNALSNHDLGPDFILYPQQGKAITVREILGSSNQWHGKRFADPLEPDYNNDERIAICSVNSAGVVKIHSHARGLHSFTLTPTQTTIKISPGQLENALDESLEVIRKVGRVFDFGDKGLARISEGKIYSIGNRDAAYICSHLERHARYKKQLSNGLLSPCDVPTGLVTRLLALNGERKLPVLKGLITAPTISINGEVIDTPGYDEKSGLYLHINSAQYKKIPSNLSDKDILHATEKLLEPFNGFCFDSATSKSVLLAAILTAAVRASIKTRPAFAFDAPSAGSGKTLLASCISIIAGGDGSTHPAVDEDAELRKIFTSELRDGASNIILDNVIGALDGAAINHFITAETFKGRILGLSETITVPNQAILMMTGNNIRIHKDLTRRVLICRLDTGNERPYTREFSFCPLGYVRANRLKLVEYALTIINGTFDPAVNLKAPLGSFNDWDKLVRQPILKICALLASNSINTLELDDPISNIINGETYDPESATIELFLSGLLKEFGAEYKTPKEIYAIHFFRSSSTRNGAELLDALDSINDDMGGKLTSRKLGSWLINRKDRIANGMKLVCKKDSRSGGHVWRCMLTGNAGNAGNAGIFLPNQDGNVIKSDEKAHVVHATHAEGK
jgi:hypothetical protein